MVINILNDLSDLHIIWAIKSCFPLFQFMIFKVQGPIDGEPASYSKRDRSKNSGKNLSKTSFQGLYCYSDVS